MKSYCILFSIFVLLFFGCNKVISEKEFTQMFINKLQDEPNISKVETSGSLLVSYAYFNEKRKFDLGNAYIRIKNGEDVDRIILSYLGTALINPINIITSKGIIIPNIRSKEWIEATINRSIELAPDINKEKIIYSIPFFNSIYIVFSQETEKEMKYLSSEEIKLLHINDKQLTKYAIGNLFNYRMNYEIKEIDGIFSIEYDGIHESSLIMNPIIIENIQNEYGDKIIIAIPARNYLIGIGANDSKGILKLKDIVSKVYKSESYKISDQLYLFENNSWRVYK
ncbi:MAG: hypothetical protein A2355_07930 [Spirochaetes bacterium RIFOXYB1_FULL_32_8]|nr:MAG: hypothetical protein A2Y30_01340 [Spirochaetes bacterium GWE1_32_154]OHD82623.1 MAG: hypothetical protein A2355_07930 [Spirochaetes bacterium RIFOXYB1_FULL_32_8]